jgi:hypothetical protein
MLLRPVNSRPESGLEVESSLMVASVVMPVPADQRIKTSDSAGKNMARPPTFGRFPDAESGGPSRKDPE